jgi:PAS domain S-box-containing protein
LRDIKKFEAALAEAEERVKLMLDASPLSSQLWDRNFNLVDCNEAAVQLFGLHSKQEYIDRFHEFSPVVQSDGQFSLEKGKMYLEETFTEGRCTFEWMHQMPNDGSPIPIPVEVTLVRVKYKDDYVVAGYTRDLREHKRMMGEIEQQTNLLYTVNQVSSIMLRSDIGRFESILSLSMGIMAKAADADRVYIWRNYQREGKLYCSQIFEWSEGVESQQNNKLAVETLYSDIVPGWEERLSQGYSISGIVREMSDYEKNALAPQGILSILVTPIFLKNQFWGFVRFYDCHNERVF